MFTIIKQGNSIINIVTQSYIVSTYVCIYSNNRPISQFGTPMSETQYHKHVRINVIKNNYTIIDGSILTCRSRYDINKFNK